MPDREKVIKGLEICVNKVLRKNDCNECPYEIDGDCCAINLTNDALILLKEQDVVKPYIDIDEAKCSICKVKLTRQELLGDDVLFEDFFDYCPHCGRKVKWDELSKPD